MEKSIKKYFPVFALPTLVAFTIGFIIPFIMGIYLSFCEFTTVTDAKLYPDFFGCNIHTCAGVYGTVYGRVRSYDQCVCICDRDAFNKGN